MEISICISIILHLHSSELHAEVGGRIYPGDNMSKLLPQYWFSRLHNKNKMKIGPEH